MVWYHFWKRDTDDPLMKTFTEKYKLHLLPIPRDDIFICDVYVHNASGISAPGSIVDFLEPTYVIPPVKTGTIADVAGQSSKSVSLDIGFGLLGGFLSAIGIGNMIQKVRVGYENKGTRYLKFRFTNIQHDSVNVVKAAKNLIDHTIPENHPLYDPKNKYYLVTAVVRTPSISMTAEDDNHQKIDIDLKALGIAEISPDTIIEKSSHSEIGYGGRNSLVFGIEVHELNYNPEKRTFKMNPMNKFVGLRGAEDREVRRPALIGDPTEGYVFLTPSLA